MSYSERGLTRREHIAMLSVTTAVAVIGSAKTAEAQTQPSFLARLIPRLFLWVGVAYVVSRAMSDRPERNTAATSSSDTAGTTARQVDDATKLVLAQKVADKIGLDLQWGRYIVDTHGLEVGQKVIAGKIAVWPQHDTSGQRIVDLSLTNDTQDPKHGAMHIVIRDTATNQEEFNYVYRGYLVAPRSTLTYPVPFFAPFTRAGLKEFSLRNQGVLTTSSAEVVVLPLNVRS